MKKTLNKSKYMLLAVIIVCLLVILFQNKTNTTNIINQSNEIDNEEDWLDIPQRYFSSNDLQWSNSTQRAYKNIAVYQSYPTLETKIKNYENLSQEMVNRTMEDIRKELNSKQVETDNNTTPSEDVDLNPFDFWRSFNRIEDSYAKYGKLNMNYYPDKYNDTPWAKAHGIFSYTSFA